MRRSPFLALLLLPAAPVFAQDAPPPPAPAASIEAGPSQTRAEAEALAVATFNRLDLNHDGFVTMDEMIAVVAKQRGTTPDKITTVPPMVKAMMDDADTNHDGKVSLDEAKAATLRDFDEADTNHDGIVTPTERMAAQAKIMNALHPKAAVGR